MTNPIQDLKPYIDGWRRRAARAEAAKSERQNRALALARRCAAILADDFGAERVFLIGSLAEGCFRLDSDIDLVAEGVSPRDYFTALSKVSTAAGDFDVDLILWESYKYQDEVLEKGVILYESP